MLEGRQIPSAKPNLQNCSPIGPSVRLCVLSECILTIVRVSRWEGGNPSSLFSTRVGELQRPHWYFLVCFLILCFAKASVLVCNQQQQARNNRCYWKLLSILNLRNLFPPDREKIWVSRDLLTSLNYLVQTSGNLQIFCKSRKPNVENRTHIRQTETGYPVHPLDIQLQKTHAYILIENTRHEKIFYFDDINVELLQITFSTIYSLHQHHTNTA